MEPAADTPERPRPGHVLAAERERQGLSRAEVAHRMHMSAAQIEALESEDYARLPSGPFRRGFLRNYAKLLGVNVEPLLATLAEAGPHDSAPRIVVPTQNIRFDPTGERLSNPYVKAGALAVVAVALGFAAMYWWLFVRPAGPGVAGRTPAAEPGPPQQLAEAPVFPAQVPAPTPAPLAEPGDPIDTAGPEAAQDPAPAQGIAAPAPAEPPRAGERVLRFRFSGESWIEVRDSRDRVLMSRLNEPGSQAEVAGRPPLTVVVGNAPVVEMTADSRPFDLAPHTRVGVARFTLE